MITLSDKNLLCSVLSKICKKPLQILNIEWKDVHYIIIDGDNTILYEEYFKGKKPHRENGPAYISYNYTSNSNENISSVMYYVNGKLHREDGPASIGYYTFDNKLAYELYYRHDVNHNMNGPARIIYDEIGGIVSEEYYLAGDIITKEIMKWYKKHIGYYIPYDAMDNATKTLYKLSF